jgi:hypothetical protein
LTFSRGSYMPPVERVDGAGPRLASGPVSICRFVTADRMEPPESPSCDPTKSRRSRESAPTKSAPCRLPRTNRSVPRTEPTSRPPARARRASGWPTVRAPKSWARASPTIASTAARARMSETGFGMTISLPALLVSCIFTESIKDLPGGKYPCWRCSSKGWIITGRRKGGLLPGDTLSTIHRLPLSAAHLSTPGKSSMGASRLLRPRCFA